MALLSLFISFPALIVSFFQIGGLPFDAAWIAIVICGLPIIKEAVEGLITSLDIKADVLVSSALVAAVAVGEVFAAGEVAFIMALGEYLEERTVLKAAPGSKSWCGRRRPPPGCCGTERKRSSRPARSGWAICCGYWPARPSPWTALS
jgi:cation transport ATPase